MRSINKILMYRGIPVGLALLLLIGGLWSVTLVSRADRQTGSYGVGSAGYIWAPPMAPTMSYMGQPWAGVWSWSPIWSLAMAPRPDMKQPWADASNRPRDASSDSSLRPTAMEAMEEQRDLTDSEKAQMRTIEILQKDGIAFLTATALQEKMKSSWHGIVIDVGAKSAYAHGHILGAINMPENQIGTLAPIVLPDRQVPIVTYCGSTQCTASISAAKQLKALGYAEVYDFWGGLKAWVAMGLPTRGSEVAGK